MKFQSNCNCNRLHLYVIDPNSDNDCVNLFYFTGRQIVPEDLLPNFLLKMVSTIKYLVALKVNRLKINGT